MCLWVGVCGGMFEQAHAYVVCNWRLGWSHIVKLGCRANKSIEKQLQATWLCAEGLQLPQKNLMHQTLRTALSPAFTRSDCTLAWFWNVKRFGFVEKPLRVVHSYYTSTLDVFITASSTWDFGLIGFFSKCSIPVKDSFIHCEDESLSLLRCFWRATTCVWWGESTRGGGPPCRRCTSWPCTSSSWRSEPSRSLLEPTSGPSSGEGEASPFGDLLNCYWSYFSNHHYVHWPLLPVI